MQPGEKIKEYRIKNQITQTKLGEIIELTQGYISDIERGKQKPSRKFIKKTHGVLNFSKDDLEFLLTIADGEESKEILPDAVKENQKTGYEILNVNRERRLPQNTKKRKLIDNVLKILDSEDDKVIRVLKGNISISLLALGIKEPEIKGGD
jgi:transcriptional regulator with XRE-family HTH domain